MLEAPQRRRCSEAKRIIRFRDCMSISFMIHCGVEGLTNETVETAASLTMTSLELTGEQMQTAIIFRESCMRRGTARYVRAANAEIDEGIVEAAELAETTEKGARHEGMTDPAFAGSHP